MKIVLIGAIAAAFTAGLGGGGHGFSAANAASTTVAEPVDVEIAIDGTGSMATAIARAKSAGARAVAGVSELLPDTRFAIVVFRDHGNPAAEYQLLQPLTDDDAKVQDALNRVSTHSNPSPSNGLAESYNLAFRESYSDSRIGWRPTARKVVVVLGDAEPNGAGTSGLSGCRDRSSDPNRLSTRQELANMRAAKLTLIMIRELSAGLSVSRLCYESLAAGAFVGGSARDADDGTDIAGMIIDLVKGAYAPTTVKNDVGVALRNGRTGYTITVRNPNALSLTITSLEFILPRVGFRYVRSSTASSPWIEPIRSGRTLSWTLNRTLRPRSVFTLHLTLKAPGRTGAYRSGAIAHIETAGGRKLVSPGPTQVLRVKRRLTTAAVRLVPLRTGEGVTLRGRLGTRFGKWRGLPAVGPAHGSLVLTSRATRIVLLATRFELDSLAVPTRAQIKLRVAAVRGRRRCNVGASARLGLSSVAEVTRKLVLHLPQACGGTIAPKTTLAVSAS
jgi:hypothetical protein